ncbi:hypothetical protein NLX86_06545 [Streptomyces sp. A3M-1-3]|uniref:hypothetical protein n=1 Tax=Streptomyces sp. A3M-1-3 TaxID=2962044 RepID=UPI0020B6E91B|nr:hypothetical protein [Streptomyces sp. A3M-1-3]MCP3817805.1 hypothetical protein [Streptomyces sp. A3M-1-3]
MTGRVEVTGALFVDLGHQLKDGTWARPPRARYECLRCHTREGPVTGAVQVAGFVATARTDHRANCPANVQGAQAA